ncbi:MAG: hypothetical protein AABY15_04210 [Nanoarchaeota archaeon]
MIGELISTGITFGVGRNAINDQFSGTAEFNNIILESGANFSGGTGGGIIFSAGTNLYNIFEVVGAVSQVYVQPGTNITTGGTPNNPTINLDGSISLSEIRTTGGLSGGQNSDTTSYIGRAAIGYGAFSDYAWFSHLDFIGTTGYALIQGPDGSTTVNSTLSGTGIGFRLDNVDYLRISGVTGNLGIKTTPHASYDVNVLSSMLIGGSLYFDGSNSRIGIGAIAASDAVFAIGTGQFTDDLKSYNNVIAGSSTNTVSSVSTSMIGGAYNGLLSANYSFVIGRFNTADTVGESAIIGGTGHTLYGNRSAIIGGQFNYIPGSVRDSVIIAANSLSADTDFTTYTQRAYVDEYLDLNPQTVLPTAKIGRMFFSGTPLFKIMVNTGGTSADWAII